MYGRETAPSKTRSVENVANRTPDVAHAAARAAGPSEFRRRQSQASPSARSTRPYPAALTTAHGRSRDSDAAAASRSVMSRSSRPSATTSNPRAPHARAIAEPRVPRAPRIRSGRRARLGSTAVTATLPTVAALAPPAVLQSERCNRRTVREGLRDRRHRGRTRRIAANVERSRFVRAVAPDDQRVPVKAAKKRPERHRADVGAVATGPAGGGPRLHQPPHLLFARTPRVHLGDGDRQPVALPRLHQDAWCPAHAGRARANGVDVDVEVPSVAAGAAPG